MTIINPNSISGITSFTAEADVMNFYRSNGTLGSLQLNGVNFNTTNGISTFNNLNVGGVLTYEDVKNVDSVGIISARTAIHVGAGISAVGIITGTSFRGDGSQLTGITQVGGATTVGFDDNKSIYFGSQDDYRMGWSGTTMSIEPTSSSTTQILHLTSNNQMYIKSKASGLFLMSGNQNVIDIYGGYGGGIYFKNNNTQYLKLEYSNWTFLNNTEVRIPDKLVHAGDENTSIRFPAADTITAETGGSERLRIASNGNVSIGNNPTVHADTIFHIEDSGETNIKVEGSTSTLGARISLQNNDTTANAYSQYAFNDAGGQSTSAIQGINTDQTNNYGELAFLTRNAQGSPPAERMRITSDGYSKHSNDGTYDGYSNAGDAHEFRQSANKPTLWCSNSNSSHTWEIIRAESARSNSSAYGFITCTSGNLSDDEFRVRGDGEVFADGGTINTGADYAEYFEWSDGNSSNEDRRGITVVLDGNKVKISTSSDSTDNIIGVVSGRPSVVGDGAWNKWTDKYLKDDYGAYQRDENGERKQNPSFDDTKTYVPREDRKEWDAIGMVGKLRIRKGQKTGTRWIKMRDISASIEEWLVR